MRLVAAARARAAAPRRSGRGAEPVARRSACSTSPTRAARTSSPRTRCTRSSARSAPARTCSSSTSASRATARSSSRTTRRSAARRTAPARSRRARSRRSAGSTARTGSPAAAGTPTVTTARAGPTSCAASPRAGASRRAASPRRDFRVPTLREVMAAFPRTPINIEIKGRTRRETDAEYIRNAEVLARQLGRTVRRDLIVVSFKQPAVDRFHALAPLIRGGARSRGRGRVPARRRLAGRRRGRLPAADHLPGRRGHDRAERGQGARAPATRGTRG